MTGVYVITNAITGSQYVGQSVDIRRRIMEHKTPNSSLKSKSKKFVEDIQKYGIQNFTFEVLEECRRDELLAKEREWINKLQPEYNVIAKNIPKETRERISKKLKRLWEEKPEEEKQDIVKNRLIGPAKGHAVSVETRKKLRDANLGKRLYKVKVVETGIVYRGAKECAIALGCCTCTIRNQLNGKTRTAKGYHLERVETNRDECSGVSGK